MAHFLKLKADGLQKIRDINPRLMSYNVEMTEVTGGTFWKAYTEGQIAGTEEFPKLEGGFQNHTAMAGLMQYYPPIDTTNEKLISLAKELGSVWVRVSGTWATKTYYDFDGTTGGKAPEGYQSVLTREQWTNIINFVKAIDSKLLVSASNCAGDHKDGAPLDLTQIKKLFALTDELGGRIDAFEFMNEPNMLQISGAPIGYTFEDYVRDQDIANAWVRETMQIEKICSLLQAISGAPNDKSDDLIRDDELYHRYVDMLAIGDIPLNDSEAVLRAAENAAEDFREPWAGGKKQLVRILQIMLYAHAAAKLRDKAEEILSTLE